MKKLTLKQFSLSFNRLSKKVQDAADRLTLAEAKLKMVPNDRYAKKAVTVSSRILSLSRWELFKFLAKDLEVKQAIDFDGEVTDLVPPWQVPADALPSDQLGRQAT